mmetsp:Transcript_32451/g.39281  ORF Transcript_32451/g.39281 Transcript_32451/m.39281 type:complete len:271 (+) Transcript_32451:79-891(+)|eukprot:CAMPEP_0197845540 /NCGR_PEP_ID=MMETSP1438-20131217/2461_1 /TAXON_ID=1461541 /ORGANISM="Pterosperma sp., Strain CCMP1384" /LENGTH=270 /DNA_ID=CAMNT_0043456877 /DNA_START=78 /DNA_END=890 /DNA_ORIENTATION=+
MSRAKKCVGCDSDAEHYGYGEARLCVACYGSWSEMDHLYPNTEEGVRMYFRGDSPPDSKSFEEIGAECRADLASLIEFFRKAGKYWHKALFPSISTEQPDKNFSDIGQGKETQATENDAEKAQENSGEETENTTCLGSLIRFLIGASFFLALPILGLTYAYVLYDDQGASACSDAADWLMVTGWFDVAVFIHQIGCLKIAQNGYRKIYSPWIYGYPSIAMILLHLGWTIYGTVILTRARGKYDGCDSMGHFSQAYAWILVLAHCSMLVAE